jgi:streptomycin 6-kinase
VLSARREPWLAIDPKPLVGEREFSLAPIIRSAELGFSREHVITRLNVLAARLGLDRERARLWTVGQTLAWCEGEHTRRHIDTARWLAEA